MCRDKNVSALWLFFIPKGKMKMKSYANLFTQSTKLHHVRKHAITSVKPCSYLIASLFYASPI